MLLWLTLKPQLCLALLLLFLQGIATQSAVETLPTGVVIEKVVVTAEPDQSYAVYLPTKYNSQKQWPVIFCFDPGARGLLAIEHFKDAAEKYGYVVVCSNNSRNALEPETEGKILSALWRDAHSRISIDEHRRYFAGFSGGARLAVDIALRCGGCAAGVMGSGAGFPSNLQPPARIPFAYFATVGYDDFNFGEILELGKKLDESDGPHRVQRFAGGHEWPPPQVSERALRWFSLQAMKSGTLARDVKFIDDEFASDLREAEELQSSAQFVEGLLAYVSIVRDFQGLREVEDAQKSADEIKQSSGFRKQVQLENDLIQRQLKETGEIRSLWMKEPLPDETPLARSEARKRLNDWKKKNDTTEDSPERRLARRILFDLVIGAREAAVSDTRANKYESAIANLELVRAIEPGSQSAAYELARVLSLNKEKRAALQTLEEAVALGFKDVERMRTDAAFAALIREPRFQKLVSRMPKAN